MKALFSIGSISVASIALNLIPVQQAQAVNLVLNGNFTPATATTTTVAFGTFGGNVVTPNSTIVSNWTSAGYNFVVPNGGLTTANTPNVQFYGPSFAAPSGGNFIAADSAYGTGRIFQDVTGLNIGDTYNVSFYQAAAQQDGYVWDSSTKAPSTTVKFTGDTTDRWLVNVGGTYTAPTYINTGSNYGGVDTNGSFSGGANYTSPLMSLLSQQNAGTQTVTTGNPIVGGWQQNTFSFIATAATERLSFLAQGTPTGQPPFALLAGVSIEAASSSSTSVPEPEDFLGSLIGLGLIVGLKSRLAKDKLTKKD
jgi:hypothetical protein